MKSNITIAPNIYARSSHHLHGDENFVQHVHGYKALNILKTKLPKTYASRMTKAQIEEMKQNVVCRYAKTREHSYGKAMVNGKIVWSCRCENTSCYAYEKCMDLPHAVKINRFAPQVEAADEREDSDNGFDYNDCSFEPPHVSIILPILNTTLETSARETAEVERIAAEKEKAFALSIDGDSDLNPLEFFPEFMLDLMPELPDYESMSPDMPTMPVVAEPVVDTQEQEAEYTLYPYSAERFQCDYPDKRVLVICENSFEAGYFSTILYKNKVNHNLLGSKGYTLNRKIADVFWDYCGDVIDKDSFMDRCIVRIGGEDSELNELYDALFKLCGCYEYGVPHGLEIPRLADALNSSPELISECILNMTPDFPVTISALESITPDDEYDEIMLLEGENALAMYDEITKLFGVPPIIVQKETPSGWAFNNSALGRPCRVGLNNYSGQPGSHCLNVELGLGGDVDGKNFLTEQTGDSIRLQLYIAEKIKEGDELSVAKDAETGVYRFCHDGNALGEFPPAIIRELTSIDGFPDDFIGLEGFYVRNIVTCVSEKDDASIPPRFRDSRIWLGLDITGYARVSVI